MSTYKDQLLKALSGSGWEQVGLETEFEEWYLDEQWRMRSTRKNWGMEILISFMVDPHSKGPRKKGAHLWAIMASTECPTYFSTAEGHISTLGLYRGKYNEKLDEFIVEINNYRERCDSQA